MSKKFSYEKAIKELNEIVQAIQNEDVGLDELGEKIVQANKLITQCKQKLRSIEDQIEEIISED